MADVTSSKLTGKPSKDTASHIWLVHSLFEDNSSEIQSEVVGAFTTLDMAKKYIKQELEAYIKSVSPTLDSTKEIAYFTDLSDVVILSYMAYSSKSKFLYSGNIDRHVKAAREELGDDFAFPNTDDVPSIVEDGKLKSAGIYYGVHINKDGHHEMLKFIDLHHYVFSKGNFQYAITKQWVDRFE